MHEIFVDRHCAGLPGAERRQPFGPDTVVWIVEGHMFAAYTVDGHGLSLRVRCAVTVTTLIGQGRAISPPYLQDGGWVLLPWETHPDELRARLDQSYRLVQQDGNGGRTGAGGWG